MGNSPVTLATAATARMTQQFWFLCVHPSSPVSAKGPEVLPAASRKPACLLQAPGPQLGSPQHPHFCKPLTKAEIGWSSCLWGRAAATAMPPGSPGPSYTQEPHPLPSPWPPTPILLSHGTGRARCSKHTEQKPPQISVTGPPHQSDSPSPGRSRPFLRPGGRQGGQEASSNCVAIRGALCQCQERVPDKRGEGRGSGKAWTVC